MKQCVGHMAPQAQIAFGDREVFVNSKGEKMSRLKEVDDDWILRRLEQVKHSGNCHQKSLRIDEILRHSGDSSRPVSHRNYGMEFAWAQ